MRRYHPMLSSAGWVLGLLFAVVAAAAAQVPDAPAPRLTASERIDYVGDEACRGCHQQEFNSYLNTAHHIASRLPAADSIKGSFRPGSNILTTSNPYLYFVMTAGQNTFSQTAVVTLPPAQTIVHTEPFDLVVGSGRKGQTYLYWRGSELLELPVTYWSETRQWINSPGYPDGLVNFDKPVIPRCLECHTTFAAAVPGTRNRFERERLVLGITCERCHGPARAHVARTQAGIPLGQGQREDIVNPATLERDRQIDLCALCHAGPGTPRQPSFTFRAGMVLGEYLATPALAPDEPSDVHGHQVQQLRNSRCYLSSDLTCSTCHNVHTPQRDPASYGERCLTCHKAQSCGKYAAMGAKILSDCVNCHMPLKQSNQIVLSTQNGQVKPEVRTHRIAIYPEK